MKITLPYPPSANRYWRNWRGRTVLSAEARAYKADVGKRCKAAKLKPTGANVSLFLDVYRPRRAGDLSNRIKVIEDALQGYAFEDDDQVVKIFARRGDDKANPRVEVVVEETP